MQNKITGGTKNRCKQAHVLFRIKISITVKKNYDYYIKNYLHYGKNMKSGKIAFSELRVSCRF